MNTKEKLEALLLMAWHPQDIEEIRAKLQALEEKKGGKNV